MEGHVIPPMPRGWNIEEEELFFQIITVFEARRIIGGLDLKGQQTV